MITIRLPLAFLCSAAAFPAMLIRERLTPIKPDPSKIVWQSDRSWYHNMKNQSTEALRADAQWWSKCLAFTTLIAIIGLILK